MPDSSTDAYPYLDEALPGFHRGRVLVKAAGDSLAGLGFIGTKSRLCCALHDFLLDFIRSDFLRRVTLAVATNPMLNRKHPPLES